MLQCMIRNRNRLVFFCGLSIFLSLFLTLKPQEHKRGSGDKKAQDSLYSSSVALVIGIDNYKKWPDLKNAVKDALRVQWELEAMNFLVTYRSNLESEKLKSDIENFFNNKKIDDNSRLFTWYSGHGCTLENEAYLVPTDVPRRNVTKLKKNALRFSEIKKLLDVTKAKNVYMVFDACFSQMPIDVEEDKKNLQDIFDANSVTKKSRQILCSCIGGGGKYRSSDGNFRELFIKALRNEENADVNILAPGVGFQIFFGIIYTMSKIPIITRDKILKAQTV